MIQFADIARWAAEQLGKSYAFVIATAMVILWLVTGPLFDWSDTWQLVCNTVTTIITFLMVFLLQNSENRNTIATQAKLDELIRASAAASNQMVRIEDLTEDQLRDLRDRLERRA